MNIAISEGCNHDKVKIRIAIPFVPESTVVSERIDKNKDDCITVTCRYRFSAGDFKKNNYVIQTKSFEIGTTEDVLCGFLT